MSIDPRRQSFIRSGLDDAPPALRGAHVAIGNFDGMHRGHQAVLESALQASAPAGRPAVALTFEPHPRDFFKPTEPVFRLTPPAAKARVAAALGLQGLVAVPFDASVAALPAERFVQAVLRDALAVSGVSIGWNFRFGAGRGGTPEVLSALGLDHGVTVAVVEPFRSEDGSVVSSSRIRDLIGEGDIAAAAGLLGYRWFFDGVVVNGEKRGRTIGYPTANVRLAPEVRLAHGIYAVVAEFGGERRHGVASYGRRPTFDNGAAVFETYVFDFSGDLYGETMTVTPVARLRDEMKFDNVAALVEQMDRDSAEARAMLTHLQPVSPLDGALLFS
ncbi:MAG TPA: bifunctional riboflavin kinase/FAD synthetase [Methylomirabilota bacterium]|nr:bifunctional riboflavin kinase/FAD synthetase [Methylomirabilota bacterium]